jgi:glycosyltransferase involved in cell wall biosynthesis
MRAPRSQISPNLQRGSLVEPPAYGAGITPREPCEKITAAAPVVSVVVPAFNAAAFLNATLESVLAQTHRKLEIIVVDDGSTDDTAAIAEHYVNRDGRVRLLRQCNAGVGAARNAALAFARGKYIAPIDADDVWHPTKIAAQVAVMEAGGERLGFVYCWSQTIDLAGAITGVFPPCDASGSVVEALVFRNFLHNASVPLFRASALREVGGYVTRAEQGGAQGCEDWELTVRVAERREVGVVREYLVGYREVIAGMSSGGKGMVGSYEHMITALRGRNPEIPARLLRWSAGYFHLYIARKCCQAGDPGSSLRALRLAVKSDPAVLSAPPFLRALAGSLWQTANLARNERKERTRVRRVLSSAELLRASRVPWSWWIFSRIEARRWCALQVKNAAA